MSKEKATKIVFSVFGVILGIVILIMGIVTMNTKPNDYSTTSTDSYTFGADFYTEQYKATKHAADNAKATANNVRELGSTMATCFGTLLLATGLLVSFFSLKKAVVTAVSTEGEKTVQTPVEQIAVDQTNDTKPSVEEASPAKPSDTEPIPTNNINSEPVAKPIFNDEEPAREKKSWECPECGFQNSPVVSVCIKCNKQKPE